MRDRYGSGKEKGPTEFCATPLHNHTTSVLCCSILKQISKCGQLWLLAADVGGGYTSRTQSLWVIAPELVLRLSSVYRALS